jgi:parallel beta-helix repeat protein
MSEKRMREGYRVYIACGMRLQHRRFHNFGIATVSDPTYPSSQDPTGSGDRTSIHDNSVLGTQVYDGLDVCSDNNTITNNTVFSSGQSGIHLDSSCGSTGKNNVVTFNTINEACAGILQGGTPNTLGGGSLFGLLPLPGANIFFNDTNTVLAGNTCPAVATSAVPAFTTNAVSQPGLGGGTLHPTPVQ